MPILDLLRGGKKYRAFLLLSAPQSRFLTPQLWSSELFSALDAVFKAAGCRPSIHRREVTPMGKERPFGKLSWTHQGIEDWAFRDSGSEWLFIDLQLFCPSRGDLIKSGSFPSVYVQIQPLGTREGGAGQSAYGDALLLLLGEPGQAESAVDAFVTKARQATASPAAYRGELRVRGLNEFESVLRERFMYRGLLEDPFPNPARMRGKWDFLSP
jgi:hypothetical protein